jgi:hypothetical protein
MTKDKRESHGLPRGTMVQIMKCKELADKFWGGEKARQEKVGKSCADCLYQGCSINCKGIKAA